MKRLLRSPRIHAALVRLVGWYLELALRTTRWRLEGIAHAELERGPAPLIIAFWHETLPLMPMLAERVRALAPFPLAPVHVLVSRHRDGQAIGDIMRRFAFTPLLGSTSRGGPAALRSLIACLRAGHLIAITPDGPRGPARQAAAGVAQIAALSGVAIVPCGAATRPAVRLRSWDRMRLPLPFGRGVISVQPLIRVDRDAWQDALPGIAAAMTRAITEAEQLCRA